MRELALRFAAEHVGQDVLAYRQAHGIADPWKSGQRLLVAVSASPTSAALVRWTRRLAGELQAPWVAVYVELPQALNADEQARLARHLALARELGAQVITTTDDDVARGLLRVAREQNATQLVVGKPVGWRALDLLRGGSLLNRLIRESGHIDIHAVRAEGEAPCCGAWPRRAWTPGAARGYGVALGFVAGATCLNALLQQWLGYQSLALIYLLSVVVLAMFVGRGPTLVAATLTALLWNFCFVPPVFTFRINGHHRPDALLHLLRGGAGDGPPGRPPARAAGRRAPPRAAGHGALLAHARIGPGFRLRGPAGDHHPRSGQGHPGRGGPLAAGGDPGRSLTPYFASTWAMAEKEQSVALWAFLHRQPAGRGTDTLPSAEGLHLPLLAGERAVGVLSLRFRDPAPLATDQRDLLDAFVRQIALVLDRQRLRDAEQQAKLVAESERLSKTLLNSISHEIRTPIAAITSAASSLSETCAAGAGEFERTMVGEIQEAARRLNRLVGNLLSMTRLESGHVKANLDWCDVADLVQVTLKEIEKDLAQHKVTVGIAPGLPLVRMDFVLMQQALTNLLLNAAVHTPPGTAVQVNVAVEGETPGIDRGRQRARACPRMRCRYLRQVLPRPGGPGGRHRPGPGDRQRIRRSARRPGQGREPPRRRGGVHLRLPLAKAPPAVKPALNRLKAR